MTAQRPHGGFPKNNPNDHSSKHFHVYPEPSAAEIYVLDDGPGGSDYMPRFFRVMGAVAEGATEMLVVRRADTVDVPIPIPWTAVGEKIDCAITHLLPYTVTAVRPSATGPTFTVTGEPDADYEVVITITDPGDGVDVDSVEFSVVIDGGAPTTAQNPTSGDYTLGATGLTLHFETPDVDFEYTDNSTFEFESFVTTASNILVQW